MNYLGLVLQGSLSSQRFSKGTIEDMQHMPLMHIGACGDNVLTKTESSLTAGCTYPTSGRGKTGLGHSEFCGGDRVTL